LAEKLLLQAGGFLADFLSKVFKVSSTISMAYHLALIDPRIAQRGYGRIHAMRNEDESIRTFLP